MQNDIPFWIDSVICFAIALRIIFFCKRGRTLKRSVSWMAAFIALVYINLPFLWLYDEHRLAEYAMMATNVFMLMVIYRKRGNISHLFKRSE